jgi:hypothetical protein
MRDERPLRAFAWDSSLSAVYGLQVGVYVYGSSDSTDGDDVAGNNIVRTVLYCSRRRPIHGLLLLVVIGAAGDRAIESPVSHAHTHTHTHTHTRHHAVPESLSLISINFRRRFPYSIFDLNVSLSPLRAKLLALEENQATTCLCTLAVSPTTVTRI